MSNHLKDQTSPYLLQHADNPVDWYPWGTQAFEKAERENKPIFLSIGYSTCHWCHVMAHESFENKEIAEILNQYFVAVKVDREERPDIDSVYMSVCQTFSGNGGWPMSIFMTAQQKPFFAGTYFPPETYTGMIGFRDVLLAIAEKWKKDKAALLASADEVLAYMNMRKVQTCRRINKSLTAQAAALFTRSFDKKNGGFGEAPKFPMPHNLLFLMLYSQVQAEKDDRDSILKQVAITLDRMQRGGIFDQIGYGFSRYSTDAYFLAPHFEKMLYDNALLIIAYSAAYKVTGQSVFLDTAEKTAVYIFREMTGSAGEFYAAQDADSEGEEGKFYVWRHEEVCEVLGRERGERFCKHFDITRAGNFEGKNIANLLKNDADDFLETAPHDFAQEREVLYAYRRSRAALHLDDKILTAWNALMICAMCVLYRTTGNRKYLLAAEKNQAFIEKNLADQDLLYVSCRNGVRSVNGFLDEYACYTAALICLYEASFQEKYLTRAQQICQEAQRQFADDAGGYFLYGTENSRLVTRPKETYDGALPSGNSVMAYCLVRLSQLTEKQEYAQAAEKQLAFMAGQAAEYPAGYSMFLIAQLYYFYSPQKITAVLPLTDLSDASAENLKDKEVAKLPLYAQLQITGPGEMYRLLNQETTYYVCKNHTCLPPSNQVPFSI